MFTVELRQPRRHLNFFLNEMSDSEEEILLSSSAVKYYIAKSLNKKGKISAHPINTQRYEFGEFHHLFKQLRDHPEKFIEYMRMNIQTFDYILAHISNRIQKVYRNCHSRPILPEERLMVTVRYVYINVFIKENMKLDS